MSTREVATQAELDAVPPGMVAVVRAGVFTACGSATVRASGSATVHAYDSATVRASGSATVHATPCVAVHRHSTGATIVGGILIDATGLTDPQKWCRYHGLAPVDGSVVLHKAVEDDWKGTHKRQPLIYRPGRQVTAADWDPTPSCGGGLHLAATPWEARVYCPDAAHYVAAAVALADLVVIDRYKAKARTLRVLHEVDIDGNPLVAEEGAS
jgi:hypothetical protein